MMPDNKLSAECTLWFKPKLQPWPIVDVDWLRAAFSTAMLHCSFLLKRINQERREMYPFTEGSLFAAVVLDRQKEKLKLGDHDQVQFPDRDL